MAVTIQEKVYRTLALAPEGFRKEVLWALVEYTEGGISPTGDEPWYFLFAAFAEDCQNSHDFIEKQRANGRKGGRPRKETHSETGLNPDSEVGSTFNSVQSNSVQINTPINARARELAEAHRTFEPPTLDEVKAYAETNNLKDPDGFFAYYDAQGWVTGAGLPITNWQSKLMAWSADERSKKPKKHSLKYAGVA